MVQRNNLHMRILRDGTWLYQGTPINRKPLVKLFASVLRREPDGSFWLVTPVERGIIEVDDAPFTAVEVDREGEGNAARLVFRTNIDERVVAGPEHPIRVAQAAGTGEPSPYVMVRDGLEALIVRPVFYQLVEMADERAYHGAITMGVWSDGCYFPLGTIDPDPIAAPAATERAT
jgi:uncharacterized protein